MAGQFRQGNHLQILKGCGIGKYLEIFRFHLFVAPKPGEEIDAGEGDLGTICPLRLVKRMAMAVPSVDVTVIATSFNGYWAALV